MTHLAGFIRVAIFDQNALRRRRLDRSKGQWGPLDLELVVLDEVDAGFGEDFDLLGGSFGVSCRADGLMIVPMMGRPYRHR